MVISSDNHIIHIEKNNAISLTRSASEQCMITVSFNKLCFENSSAKALKPRTWGLFDTIESPTKMIDVAEGNRETRGMNHVYHLCKINTGDIHLIKCPISGSNNHKEGAPDCHASNQCRSDHSRSHDPTRIHGQLSELCAAK